VANVTCYIPKTLAADLDRAVLAKGGSRSAMIAAALRLFLVATMPSVAEVRIRARQRHANPLQPVAPATDVSVAAKGASHDR
jgi:hypothetical protein